MRRLVLVGFMGCGKSTVGARAAGMLGWRFVDMDAAIEQRLGMSVAEVFRRHGEGRFRTEETRLARELQEEQDLVVAAGGGAFAVPETREALRQDALTVWLRCDLPAALGRIRLDGSRPLASDRETIERLFAQREPSYRLAECQVDASQGPADDVAREVVAVVQSRR